MGREKEQADKLKQEIVKTVRDIVENFGMITDSSFGITQEKEHVEEKVTDAEENIPPITNLPISKELLLEEEEYAHTTKETPLFDTNNVVSSQSPVDETQASLETSTPLEDSDKTIDANNENQSEAQEEEKNDVDDDVEDHFEK